MTITVNGKSTEIDAPISIIALLHLLDIHEHNGVAIAQNQTLIRKSEWEETPVQEGDEIEILQATAGG